VHTVILQYSEVKRLKSNPKILILTAKFGNGHVQVAKVLEQTCKQMGLKNVFVSDLFSEAHPILTELTQYLYLKSFTIGKQFYRIFYYGIDKMYNKKITKLYYHFGIKRLEQLISEIQPDLIINTFPFNVVLEYQSKTGNKIPTFNVITDYCLHKIWVHHEIDKYYVAAENVKESLLKVGVPASSVKITGIPIRKSFEEPLNPSAIFNKYHFDSNKKILLIMAGAHGVLKNVKEICQTLSAHHNIQIVVVCGKNEALKEELFPLSKQIENLRVFGYVERIDELFRISACMITKPGGITLTEATALGLPCILYKPVPGQEKENAIFFERQGAAVIANGLDEVIFAVDRLLRHEHRLTAMKSAMKSLHRANAAVAVIEDILQFNTQQLNKHAVSNLHFSS
jgi:processive 1,2-diacylglycerol beta-glucosyltransferase